MPKLTAISTALLPESTKLQIFPYYFNAFQFLSGTKHNEMFESRIADLIDNKIQIYDSQLGYPSNLTSVTVIEHLWDATMAFHLLRELRKRANAEQVSDSHGINIGKALSSRVVPKDGTAGPSFVNLINSINWTKEAVEQYDMAPLPAYSNKEWSTLVGRAEGAIMLPKSWAAIISYYTDNMFSLQSRDDDGHTQLINLLVPAMDLYYNSTITNGLVITSYLEKLENRFRENPTLRLFLSSHMNIDRVIHLFDFNRDVSAKTLSIVDDPRLLDALETTPNTFFDGLTFDEYLRGRELIYTPGDIYMSPFDYDDFVEVDTETILEKLLIATNYDGNQPTGTYVPTILSSGVLVDAYKLDSMYPMVFSLPPGTLTLHEDLGADVLGRISFAMEVFPLDVPFRPHYNFGTSGRILVGSLIGIKGGFNFYSFSENDLMTIKLDKCLSLLFDGIPFKFSYPNPILYDCGTGLRKPSGNLSQSQTNDVKNNKDKQNSNRRKKSKNNKRSNKSEK